MGGVESPPSASPCGVETRGRPQEGDASRHSADRW